MKKYCEYCIGKFDGKKNARFCQAKCRVSENRSMSATRKMEPDMIRLFKVKYEIAKSVDFIVTEASELTMGNIGIIDEENKVETPVGTIDFTNHFINFGSFAQELHDTVVNKTTEQRLRDPETKNEIKETRDEITNEKEVARKDNIKIRIEKNEKRFGKITKEDAELFMKDYEDSQPDTSSKHTKDYKEQTKKGEGSTLYLCLHCGERLGYTKKKYCSQCGTKKQRDYIDKLNYCIDVINS